MYLLDTDHCSRIIFGEPALIQQIQAHSEVGVATICILKVVVVMRFNLPSLLERVVFGCQIDHNTPSRIMIFWFRLLPN